MINNKIVSSIILCAGKSTRFGENKIFYNILEKPAIYYTIKAFCDSDLVDNIIIVSQQADSMKFNNLIKSFKKLTGKNITLTTGGESRQESVKNGLKMINNKTSFIAIHDGARILIEKKTIDQSIRDAFEHKASCVGVPVKDTIKKVNNNKFICETPARETLWCAQTPQVFERTIYNQALTKATKEGKIYTDDCQLLESNNVKVHMCLGNYSNIKITTIDDIYTCENVLIKRLKKII